jgi:putative nucleotide binding protein
MSEDSDAAVVLDYLPHGRADDDRPQYRTSPVAYALDTDRFRLLAVEFEDDVGLSIGDDLSVDPTPEAATRFREVDYGELSGGAQSELDYVVEDLVTDEQEARFLEFYQEAGPITLRLHQLDLLPGIGEKLRNAITDAREREPFADFDDVEERVDGLHDPAGKIVERIMNEIREPGEQKYHLFARDDD